jgi:hypothetical protein
MSNNSIREKLAPACAVFLAFSSFAVWSDEIEIKVRAHVKLERLHPDVEKVSFSCNYLDKQGKTLIVNATSCDAFNSTTVGPDRKVDGVMSECWKFDESWALKQSWDRYKCEPLLWHKDNPNSYERPKPNHPKAWARVKAGAVLYSEGQFKMD